MTTKNALLLFLLACIALGSGYFFHKQNLGNHSSQTDTLFTIPLHNIWVADRPMSIVLCVEISLAITLDTPIKDNTGVKCLHLTYRIIIFLKDFPYGL